MTGCVPDMGRYNGTKLKTLRVPLPAIPSPLAGNSALKKAGFATGVMCAKRVLYGRNGPDKQLDLRREIQKIPFCLTHRRGTRREIARHTPRRSVSYKTEEHLEKISQRFCQENVSL